MTYLGVAETDAEAALNHLTARSKLVATYDHAGPSASAITAIRAWQSYVADVVEGHRPPGHAEARYREGLPEELRYQTKPGVTLRQKVRPGSGSRAVVQQPDQLAPPDDHEWTTRQPGQATRTVETS
ncbi:hypothetical protein JMJ56_30990 [Belnapia sp. T18]|uniref:Uncharacterized protein n=1 Tax=Belnapia arida TaxID=2804533 RepID=A0ABS1UCI2_9PROT|nr:hypothetical protein [Belnapia arida]